MPSPQRFLASPHSPEAGSVLIPHRGLVLPVLEQLVDGLTLVFCSRLGSLTITHDSPEPLCMLAVRSWLSPHGTVLHKGQPRYVYPVVGSETRGCFQVGASKHGAAVNVLAQAVVWTCFRFS